MLAPSSLRKSITGVVLASCASVSLNEVPFGPTGAGSLGSSGSGVGSTLVSLIVIGSVAVTTVPATDSVLT